MLNFHFLGAPRLEKNGRPLALDTRKAIALAAYLVLTGAAHERDQLAALFYPDADSTRARSALRRTLSALNTALGKDVLEIERETIALPADKVNVDVLEFRALSAKSDYASLNRAIELYRGDFFDGFTLRDSPAFDEWQFFETESLRKQFASVLERVVTAESDRKKYKAAIEHARRWLALDPLHEPAHRALMQLYALDGQRAAALRQYRECVRQLDLELGVAPLPETTELYRLIEENKLSAALPVPLQEPPVGLPAEQTFDYPLVGRTAELETLASAYRAIRADGCLLILQGEAGIGKTRLAKEFLSRATQQGAAILSARAYSEQSALAYAPFVQGLRAALDHPQASRDLALLPPSVLEDAARLVPEILQFAPRPLAQNETSLAPLEGPGAQARFFDAVTQVILALTRTTAVPGVLFLDDTQWLDQASLDLLAFLIRRLKNTPLCILLTWRGQEIANDHALRRLYADALREERAKLLSLSRLDLPDVESLVNVAGLRGAPVSTALAARLYRESEGQPFFLIEALKLLEREGALPADDILPPSVRELLHSRLAQLGETARQLLSAAAVIGRSFDFETLDAVSGRSEQETVSGLEELEARELIVETTRTGLPQYDFTHDKLRALVYEETSLARRRLLHRRAAEAILHRPRPNTDALAGAIANHLREGGDDARAADYFKRAGDYARSVFANRDAVENYEAALALGYPDGAQLYTSIGDARTLLGQYDAALSAYETGAALGAPSADANLARVYLRRGDWETAVRHLSTALKATRDPSVQAQLYADLALAEHQSQHPDAARKHAAQALKLAQRGGKTASDPRALAQAHNILGILARTTGDWQDAITHLEASRALAQATNDVAAQAAALNNLALVYRETDDNAHALELAEQALALMTRAGDRHRQAALHNHLADLYHEMGRTADSMAQLKRAVEIYAEIGGPAGAWQPEIWKLREW